MAAAKILALVLPYLPNVLDFLSVQLGRVLVRKSPNIKTRTSEQIVLETVAEIVGEVDQAHPAWSNDDKRAAAVGGIRHHLREIYGVTPSDRELNLLVELQVTRLRARQAAELEKVNAVK